MKNRNIAFGYTLKNGSPSINKTEAETVKWIFALYEQGASFLAIAKQMTDEQVPYSDGEVRWNKNNVARILRNDKYTGTDGYPEIIPSEQFWRVKTHLDEKTAQWATPVDDPSRILWQRLRCAECGERLLRIGGMLARKGVVQLRCENAECENGHDIPLAELYGGIANAMRQPDTDETASPQAEYEPSTEVLRLTNEIDRQIERPTDPTGARRLILKAAAARYECLKEPPIPLKTEFEDNDRPRDVDWLMFERAVSHISIDNDRVIRVVLIKT